MSHKLIEYIKLHVISLEQDLEDISNQMESLDPASKDYNELDFEYNHMAGQILNARHFLSVANDILAETNEEE
jgi:hypothetical protein